MSKRKDDLPLTSEPPRAFYPRLAAELARRYGPRAGLPFAIVLERAHANQQRYGRTDRLHDGGRPVEMIVFHWSPQQQKEDFPFWSERTIRRLVGNPPVGPGTGRDSTPNLVSEDLLRKVRRRVEGRVSDDWYSVNYEAVGDACALFPAPFPPARSLSPPPASPPLGPADSPLGPADSPLGPADSPPEARARAHAGAEDPSSSLFSKREEGRARPGQRWEPKRSGDFGEGCAFLEWLGLTPDEALGLLTKGADMPARALRVRRSVEAMRAAGYRFAPWPPRGWAVRLILDNAHEITAAEAKGRAEAQRRRGAAQATAIGVAQARELAAATIGGIGPEANFLAEAHAPVSAQQLRQAEIDAFCGSLPREQYESALRAVLRDQTGEKLALIRQAGKAGAQPWVRRLVYEYLNPPPTEEPSVSDAGEARGPAPDAPREATPKRPSPFGATPSAAAKALDALGARERTLLKAKVLAAADEIQRRVWQHVDVADLDALHRQAGLMVLMFEAMKGGAS